MSLEKVSENMYSEDGKDRIVSEWLFILLHWIIASQLASYADDMGQLEFICVTDAAAAALCD